MAYLRGHLCDQIITRSHNVVGVLRTILNVLRGCLKDQLIVLVVCIVHWCGCEKLQAVKYPQPFRLEVGRWYLALRAALSNRQFIFEHEINYVLVQIKSQAIPPVA